ncbi:MAG: Spore protein SP21 [Candidatus Omnitrophica bacterium ADurb.Bin205]|nr:MAG: Spore protein SP21 [Candidatus Omnitrophica bacterium ADurb.Bin205]
MNLVPWKPNQQIGDPFSEMEQLQARLNTLFNSSLIRFPGQKKESMFKGWDPEVDIHDYKDKIIVKADVPGMKRKDIDVSVHGNTLILKGEKKHTQETKGKGYVRSERFYGSFNRMITLPSEVDDRKVKAAYKDGVLELILPKKKGSRYRNIKVEVK